MLEEVVQSLIRRGEFQPAPPPVPNNIKIEVPSQDDEDEINLSDDRNRYEYLGRYLIIQYANAKGENSIRRVIVHHVHCRGETNYLKCYCYERRAPRMFRSDRVIKIFDFSTGEIVDEKDEIITRLELLITESENLSPTRTAILKNRLQILILMFLARCDGFHPAEEDVLLSYLDYECGPPGVDEDEAREALSNLYPDEESYLGAVYCLSETNPDELIKVARSARRLIDADGAVSESEALFATQLDAALKQA